MEDQSPTKQIVRAIERLALELRPGRPSPRVTLMVSVAGMVLGVIALVLSLVAMTDDPASPSPAPSPSSSSTWSPECTAEDLEDGACYTWDDIREQPRYSQGPDGPVLVTP